MTIRLRTIALLLATALLPTLTLAEPYDHPGDPDYMVPVSLTASRLPESLDEDQKRFRKIYGVTQSVAAYTLGAIGMAWFAPETFSAFADQFPGIYKAMKISMVGAVPITFTHGMFALVSTEGGWRNSELRYSILKDKEFLKGIGRYVHRTAYEFGLSGIGGPMTSLLESRLADRLEGREDPREIVQRWQRREHYKATQAAAALEANQEARFKREEAEAEEGRYYPRSFILCVDVFDSIKSPIHD